MSDPLNDFSQQDADLRTPGAGEQAPPRPSDELETDLVGESDATGDQPALDDMDEDDDSDVSLRDVAEREESAEWN